MKKSFLFVAILFTCISFAQGTDTQDLNWPREFEHGNAKFVLYLPQLDNYNNNDLEGRMAVSVKFPDKDLIFGAIWFKAQMQVDKDNRTVLLEKMVIPSSNFPEFNEDNTKLVESILSKEIEKMGILLSLDHFLALLETLDKHPKSDALNNNPPIIHYRSTPTVLIYIDGEPILKDVDNSEWQYVVNTPYFIVQNKSNKLNYLKGGNWWFMSNSIEAGWKVTDDVPTELKILSENVIEKGDSTIIEPESTTAPEVIVATKPSELILTNGKPDYATLEGTSLLYVKNTENDIIMNINDQSHYVLISGRWYHSKVLENGDWKFTDPLDLPSDFTKISNDGPMSSVLPSIPNTDEANMALLEQSIPQTATVDRKDVTVEVKYDGNPKFEPIEGTKVKYAVNSDKSVLLINNKYYCIDDAIWFVSTTTKGPWEVSVERPSEVDEIPPSSPVYNVKYVYIYDYTPQVVYVGYTPGYMYAYPYHGVVVYGTGYHYKPWYAHHYYPRHVTYGFSVHYNSYTGWGFSYGMSSGWFSVGWHSNSYWWGCHGYRHGYRHGYHPGYRPGHRPPGYRPPHARPRPEHYNAYRNRLTRLGNGNSGVRPSQMPANGKQKPETRPTQPSNTRPATRPSQPNSGAPSTRPSSGENNIYTNKKGDVYKRDNSGNWQNRSNGNWQNHKPANNNNNRMDRDVQSRQRGNQQQQNYNRNRQASPTRGSSAPSRSPSGGGRR